MFYVLCFWNRIFKLHPVLVIHGLYYSHLEVIWDDLRGQKCKVDLKINMGIIYYVLRCSETEYSSYDQFWSSTASTTAILRSSGWPSRPKSAKFNYKVNMGIISYVLRCSETKYSGYNQFWSSTASSTAI